MNYHRYAKDMLFHSILSSWSYIRLEESIQSYYPRINGWYLQGVSHRSPHIGPLSQHLQQLQEPLPIIQTQR